MDFKDIYWVDINYIEIALHIIVKYKCSQLKAIKHQINQYHQGHFMVYALCFLLYFVKRDSCNWFFL